jgi:hypothetical protein
MNVGIAVDAIRELDSPAATPREAVVIRVVTFVDFAIAIVVVPVAQLACIRIARAAHAAHALLTDRLTWVAPLVRKVHVAANEQRLRIDDHGARRQQRQN